MCFEKFLFNFVVTLVSVLKSVTKLFLKTVLKVFVKKRDFIVLSKYLRVSTYSKKIVHFLVSFRQRYPTINEYVSPSLEF